MNPQRLAKAMRQSVRATCMHTAIIFRKQSTRKGTQWVEGFVEVQRGAAHFYSIDSSDSERGGLVAGRESYTPRFKVRLMDFDVLPGDRVVPIIQGNIGGATGKQLYEVANAPVDPSNLGVCLEAPIESMEQPYTLQTNPAGTFILVMTK